MRALLGALDRAEMVLEVLSVGGNPFSSASCPALVAAVHASRHTMQDLNTDGGSQSFYLSLFRDCFVSCFFPDGCSQRGKACTIVGVHCC